MWEEPTKSHKLLLYASNSIFFPGIHGHIASSIIVPGSRRNIYHSPYDNSKTISFDEIGFLEEIPIPPPQTGHLLARVDSEGPTKVLTVSFELNARYKTVFYCLDMAFGIHDMLEREKGELERSRELMDESDEVPVVVESKRNSGKMDRFMHLNLGHHQSKHDGDEEDEDDDDDDHHHHSHFSMLGKHKKHHHHHHHDDDNGVDDEEEDSLSVTSSVDSYSTSEAHEHRKYMFVWNFFHRWDERLAEEMKVLHKHTLSEYFLTHGGVSEDHLHGTDVDHELDEEQYLSHQHKESLITGTEKVVDGDLSDRLSREEKDDSTESSALIRHSRLSSVVKDKEVGLRLNVEDQMWSPIGTLPKHPSVVMVEVFEAKKLRSLDINGLSDPFVSVTMKTTDKKFRGYEKKKYTYFCEKTLHPIFHGQAFMFQVPESARLSPRSFTIQVKVIDHDVMGFGELIGITDVRLSLLMDHNELSGWFTLSDRKANTLGGTSTGQLGLIEKAGVIKLRIRWIRTLDQLIDVRKRTIEAYQQSLSSLQD
jgi:hypothetical protein